MSERDNNVGKDLKSLSKRIFAFTLAIYCVIGICLIICSCVLAYVMDFIPLILIGLAVGVICIVIGINVSRLSAIRLYAFGELVERVCSLENKVVGISVNSSKKNTTNKVDKQNKTKTSPSNHNGWVCPFCDHMNPLGASACKECGAEYNCWEEAPR